MKFVPQNPLAYCDKIGRRTYIENPLITLVRELIITGTYPDAESAFTYIKATYPIHRCKVETALARNNYPLASVLGIYRALTNDYSSYQIVISEISGHEHSKELEFDPRDCTGTCRQCQTNCPFGITHVLMVSSSYQVFDNIEEELLHAFVEDLQDKSEMEYIGADTSMIELWCDRIPELPQKDIIPFIGRFVDQIFDNTHLEIIKVSFSIMGGEYASPY